jgi:prepilin-type N-terminal cleavage/methylation domain-containing protein
MVTPVEQRRGHDAGFTMLEVLIAMIIGMIGLIGTFAVQQAVLRATANTSDAAVAMRLASQRMEQFAVAVTMPGPPLVDQLRTPSDLTGNALPTPKWSNPIFLDSNGACAAGTGTWTPTCRWRLEWRVANLGVGSPYDISVMVTYNIDGSNPKVVRLDLERRKVF